MIESIFELVLEFQKRDCSEYYKLKLLAMVKLRDSDSLKIYLQTNNVAHKSLELHNYTQMIIQEKSAENVNPTLIQEIIKHPKLESNDIDDILKYALELLFDESFVKTEITQKIMQQFMWSHETKIGQKLQEFVPLLCSNLLNYEIRICQDPQDL